MVGFYDALTMNIYISHFWWVFTKFHIQNFIVNNSVVQLLLTYRPFKKNMTTRGLLLIKLCRKPQIYKIYSWKAKERLVKWVSHCNYCTTAIKNLLQIFVSTMPVIDLLWHCYNANKLVVVSHDYGLVFRLPFNFCFKFVFLQSRKHTVTHVCAFKHRAHF